MTAAVGPYTDPAPGTLRSIASSIRLPFPTHADELERIARSIVDRPEWISAVVETRGDGPTTTVALAGLLRDDEEVPPALRAIAASFLTPRVAASPARVRATDPATSREAAEEVTARAPARPGGVVHRVLKAYDEIRSPGVTSGSWIAGATAREVENLFRIKTAHKRTSELLRDGLLEVCRETASGFPDNGDPSKDRDLVRGGGRVLRITTRGREELARLDDLKRRRDEDKLARDRRRLAREARRHARDGVRSGS